MYLLGYNETGYDRWIGRSELNGMDDTSNYLCKVRLIDEGWMGLRLGSVGYDGVTLDRRG